MADKLGVLVSSEEHLEHLLGICDATRKAGKELIVFLTGRGVLLTQDERFQEMANCPMVSLCNVGFDSFKLQKPVPVVKDEDFGTQARNGMMIEDCDRYIVL